MTSTSPMTWRSFHTASAKCRTRPTAWRPYWLGQGLRSTRKLSWWRSTPLPTHQLQSRRAHQEGGFLLLPWKCHWPPGGHGQRCHSQDRQSKSSLCHAQEHWSLQKNQHENQTLHLQLQCEVGSAVWKRNLEEDKDNAAEDSDIYQHMSEMHL